MPSQAEVGQRLDTFLVAHLPGLSRSAIQKLIRNGQVLIDGQTAQPKTTVREGQTIQLDTPAEPAPMEPMVLEAESIPFDILHEDDELLIINKQPGLVTHPGAGCPSGTLANALLEFVGPLTGVGEPDRPGIVHRLDKNTSGVILTAKTASAHRNLSAQFADRTTQKVYLAIVHGTPRESTGTISEPLGRSPRDRKKMTVRHDRGREAHTDYSVLESLDGFSLIEARPKTGRTHQIRVHLKTLGCPILCDKEYGREQRFFASTRTGKPRKKEESPVLERQALHAHSLTFTHPATGNRMTMTAPLWDDMADTLATLKGDRP